MQKYSKILICDDDETLCYLLKEQLLEEGYSSDIVYDGSFAIDAIKKKNYDVLLLDLNMTNIQGEEVLKFVHGYNPSMRVIIITAQNDLKKAVECIKMGAYDFISKPYNFEELVVTIDRALDHKNLLIKNNLINQQVNKNYKSRIIGSSEKLQKLLALATKSALSESNVLIEGATGTGKELLAEYIHEHSSRREKPFVVINCASLPDQLIESELFGHEKGAFTDAKSSKQGLVEIAHGGTLFLDEIGELSLSLQPKLLRFLENGEYRRIGGVNTLSSNVRVIGATNRNLLEDSENKRFRRDLLFRLNVITLHIPSLTERKEDILILANYFLESKAPIRNPKKLSKDAEDALLHYSYPGNVRELEHIIERALIFADEDLITVNDLNLPEYYLENKNEGGTANLYSDKNEEILTIEDLEKVHIKKLLTKNKWERNITATQLGISLKTLYTKIKKYDIKQE